MSEIWKPVVGYEGFYAVSDHGRVRSLDRKYTDASGRPRGAFGRVRRLHLDRKGYPSVSLCNGGCAETRRVHTLVAEAFIGPRPPGLEVLHADDVKANCSPGNLRYGTRGENARDMVENGLSCRGEAVHFAKMSETQVLSIRALSGLIPQTQIAAQFGLTQQGVSDIVRRKAWKHV